MAIAGQQTKRILVGKPISSSEEHRTRLSKPVALPVSSSDAISSTAYATEEIPIVLVGAGVGATLPQVVALACQGLIDSYQTDPVCRDLSLLGPRRDV